MALPSSGAISLLDVQNEFGGSNPIGINEYYGVAAGVPGSGTISLADFYGKSSYTNISLSKSDGYAAVSSPFCESVAATATVSVFGGKAPYTYTWSRSLGGATPSSRSQTTNSTSDSLTASAVVCSGQTSTTAYSVTVSDGISSATISVSVVMQNFGGGGGGIEQ
jgi:hypothetical protein